MLCLFTNTWATVAIFGDSMVTSRWGHSMVASKDKLLILGGMNLNHICDSSIYEVIVDDMQCSVYLQNKTQQYKLPPKQPDFDPKTHLPIKVKKEDDPDNFLAPVSSVLLQNFGRMVKRKVSEYGEGSVESKSRAMSFYE